MASKLYASMWITLFGTFLASWLLYKFFKRRNSREPPGPWGLPIVGYLPFFDRERPNLQFCELSKKYGNVFQIRTGSRKMVVVNGYKAIKEFYAKPGETLNTPDFFTSRIQAETMDCFIFVPFSAKYWIHKKILFKAVHRYTTEHAVELETAIHKSMTMFINEISRTNRQPFDPLSLCERLTVLLTFYHSYGQLFDSLTHTNIEETLEKRTTVELAEKKVAKCNVLPWLKWLPTMWGPISDCKKAYEMYRDWQFKQAIPIVDAYPGKKNRNCLVDYLCYEVSQLEKEDKTIVKDVKSLLLKMSCNVSLFGSFIPIAAATRWIIMLMALHPAVQQRVRNEIQQKIGKTRQPGVRDEKLLPYTTATLKEIFRYVSMASLGVPKCFSVDTELGGYMIPKDVVVSVNLYSANRDASVFSNSDTFDPDRFLTPAGTLNEKAMQKVIEVGMGPRRCGGTDLMYFELYTYFASLVSSCHIEQAPDHPLDPTKYFFQVGAVPKPFKVIMYEV